MAKDFDVEIREVFDKKYLKVFLKDISLLNDVAEELKKLDSVKTANVTNNTRPDITVYPNTFATIEDLQKDVTTTLESLFSIPSKKHIKLEEKIPLQTKESNKPIESKEYYSAKESFKYIQDSDVPSCFGVDSLVDCYIKQLDELSKHKNDNFCMLGIFAPWGRGKTYFYHKLKDKLLDRDNRHTTDKCKFKFVDFNVWKYQDTPAIWAYLYEILYKKLTWCQQFKLFSKNLIPWKHFIPYVVTFIILCIIFCIIIGFSTFKDTIIDFCKQYMVLLFLVFLIISFIGIYLKNPFNIWSYIVKKLHRKSYQNYLGLQNNLEKDVENLIKIMISSPNQEQLILYVDDIDRCASSKMMEVINSLRIILENPEIQKRMMVICSIDADKLIEGYCITKKAEYNDIALDDLKFEACQHIDKLFIFSIGLPKLDILQEAEYLRMLTQNKSQDIELERFVQMQPYSTNRVEGSLIAQSKDVVVGDLTDDKIYHLIVEFLQRKKIVGIPPRKLRIMYYRVLFANNIIASGNDQITTLIIDNILNKSLDNQYEINDDEVFSDVVRMVVPY